MCHNVWITKCFGINKVIVTGLLGSIFASGWVTKVLSSIYHVLIVKNIYILLKYTIMLKFFKIHFIFNYGGGAICT